MRSSEGGNERQEISAMLNMLFCCCLLKYNSKRTLSCFSASTTTSMFHFFALVRRGKYHKNTIFHLCTFQKL